MTSVDTTAPRLEQPSAPGRPPIRRIALASLAGSVLEWYDFFLYGFAATLVFGSLYFPGASSTAGVLAALGTFAVGFVARPLGGILFGHWGDRLGRKKMLIATLLVMGVPSFLIGLLPTYAAIGIAAPALLVLFRFLQGIGLGGEWGGAVLVVTESSPRDKIGLWGAVVQTGAAIGQALATGLLFVFASTLSDAAFSSWGWRVPFLLSIVLSLIGWYIRSKLAESPEFASVRKSGAVSTFPLRDVVRDHARTLIAGFAIYVGGVTVPFFVQSVFLTGYGTNTLGLSTWSVLLGVSAVHATLFLVLTLAGGLLADRFGALTVIRASLASFLVLPALGLLVVLQSEKLPALLMAAALTGGPMWTVWGALPRYFTEVFPVHVRYTGMSLSGQSATILGGLAPLALTAAVAGAGGSLWPVVLTLTILAATGLAAAFWRIVPAAELA